MVSRNDITGDAIQTKGNSEAFRNNYDSIFARVVCERCGKKMRPDAVSIHTCTPKEILDGHESVPVQG